MEQNLLAATIGTMQGIGTLGTTTDPANTLAQMISAAIGLMTVIAGVYFIFNLITGAMSIITSAGDKGALEAGRQKMTTSLIGLIITISAIFIVGLASTIFGIPNFLDFAGMINSL